MPLLEHEKVAQRGYDRQAGAYDDNRYISFPGRYLLGLFRDELLARIDPALPGRILDVATGTGVGAACFFGGAAKLFGADLSRNMMDVAKRRADAAGVDLHLTQCNARLLPFANGTFRGLVSFRLFHHVPHLHRRPIVEEMLRVLEPCGTAVLDFKNPFYGLAINQFRDHVLRRKQGYYLYPRQIRELFDGFELVAAVGVYMPFGQYLARISPSLAGAYMRLGRLWPFKYLCMNLFVVVRPRG